MYGQDAVRESDAAYFRSRLDRENDLLNSRTNVVLVLNGLAAVTVGLDQAPRTLITVMIILLNLLWVLCAQDAKRYIQRLLEQVKNDPDEALRQRVLGTRRLGTTNLIGFFVPVILLMGWLIGSAIAMARTQESDVLARVNSLESRYSVLAEDLTRLASLRADESSTTNDRIENIHRLAKDNGEPDRQADDAIGSVSADPVTEPGPVVDARD